MTKLPFLTSVVCIPLLASMLGAQTRFDFPDSRVDVTKFSYVENCIAAAKRVQDSLDFANPADVDTLEYRVIDQSNPIAPAVLEVTTKCLTHFTPQQIPPEFAQVAQQAFLYAGRDADAAEIVRLRSEAIADSTKRAYILDSFARNYINASPRRVAVAHTIVDEVLKYGDKYAGLARAGMCIAMMRAGVDMDDQPAVTKYGSIALTAIQSAPDEEMQLPGIQLFGYKIVREVNRAVYKKELLDSLRVSTQAFLKLQKDKYNEFAERIQDGAVTGLQTVPLVGEYWFPESAAKEEWPRKGKITILNFPNQDLEFYSKYAHVVVRRLGKQFPDADLVFAGRTIGYFGPKSERQTNVEAERQRHLFQEYRDNLNAVLVIAVSDLVELPPPDKRRVHLPPENYFNYPEAVESYVNIIDDDGVLVEHLDIKNNNAEQWMQEVMQVLIERQKLRQK